MSMYHIFFYKSVFSPITDPNSLFFLIPRVPTFWEWFKMMMQIMYLEMYITFFFFSWLSLPCLEDITICSPWKEKAYFLFHNGVFECVLGMGKAGQIFSFQGVSLKLRFSIWGDFTPPPWGTFGNVWRYFLLVTIVVGGGAMDI